MNPPDLGHPEPSIRQAVAIGRGNSRSLHRRGDLGAIWGVGARGGYPEDGALDPARPSGPRPNCWLWVAGPNLRSTLEDEVERRFGCSTERGEARGLGYVTQPALTGLGSEPGAHLLRQRRRRAD